MSCTFFFRRNVVSFSLVFQSQSGSIHRIYWNAHWYVDADSFVEVFRCRTFGNNILQLLYEIPIELLNFRHCDLITMHFECTHNEPDKNRKPFFSPYSNSVCVYILVHTISYAHILIILCNRVCQWMQFFFA